MTIVANTFTTYSAKGIREDLSNVITNIAPEETPFMSNIGRESVSNTLFEFQTDTLAAAAPMPSLKVMMLALLILSWPLCACRTIARSAARLLSCQPLKKW